MQKLLIGLMLFCGAISGFAWDEMDASAKTQCFRARRLNKANVGLCNHKEFRSSNPSQASGSYADFYEDGKCADMVFGTAFTPSGKFYDMFLPSYSQTKRLMEGVAADVEQYLQEEKNIKTPEAWGKVLGVYPMRGATFGLEHPTPYPKMPFTSQSLVGSTVKQDVEQGGKVASHLSGVPECCIVYDDVVDTGRTEFKTFAQIIDELVPNMTAEQRSQFKIVMAAAYLKNGRDESGNARFNGESYSLGKMSFRGSVQERLMMHAKLRVMDDFLAQPEQSTLKENILSLDEGCRGYELREIFETNTDLVKMAYERYIQFVDPNFICKVTVNDFVQKGWIDQEAVDNIWIAFPQTSVNPYKGLNIQEPLQKFFAEENIKHCLEPMFYLPGDGIILHTPADHSNVSEEITDRPNEHESNILILEEDAADPKDGTRHHKVANGWLDFCKGRHEWKQGETIGVILLDPYAGEESQKKPTGLTHPNLLEDVMKGMKKDLEQQGYKVAFRIMTQDGIFLDTWYDATHYPQAVKKSPVLHKLIDSTVRVIRHDQHFLESVGAYGKTVRIVS